MICQTCEKHPAKAGWIWCQACLAVMFPKAPEVNDDAE